MDLTNEDVAEILALLDSLPYDELDLQTPRFRLTLRRAAGGWTEESQLLAEPEPATPAPSASPASPAPAPEPPGPEPAASDVADRPEWEAVGLVAVAAPLPGTFYRAPRPGAAPFVEVGGEVHEDTVVAIVETMKMMNSVHAGTRGRVAEICLDNAAPVGQGAILMWIEPDA